MKLSAYDLNRKAKEAKRKEKLKKLKAKNKPQVVETNLNQYYIYARARRTISHQAESIKDALKWALSNIPVQDVLEIHDENYKLLWGRATGLNIETYSEKHGKL